MRQFCQVGRPWLSARVLTLLHELSYHLAKQLYDQSCSRYSSGLGYRTVSDMVACDKQKKPSQKNLKKNSICNTSSTITSEDPLWAAKFYVKNVCHPVTCWWNSSIEIMPRLRAWCPRNRYSTPDRGKTSFLQSIKNSSGTHPASYSTGPEAFSLSPRGYSSQDVNLITRPISCRG